MKKLLLAAVAAGVLAGCHNTWHGVKEDGSHIISRSFSGIGRGVGKAGNALERAGDSIGGNRQAASAAPAPAQTANEIPASDEIPPADTAM